MKKIILFLLASASAFAANVNVQKDNVTNVVTAPIVIPLSSLSQSGATTGQVPSWNGSAWIPVTGGGGGGTVTSVSVTTANGVSGTVANATTTPAISLSLGAITPTSVSTSQLFTPTGNLTITSGDTTGILALKAHGGATLGFGPGANVDTPRALWSDGSLGYESGSLLIGDYLGTTGLGSGLVQVRSGNDSKIRIAHNGTSATRNYLAFDHSRGSWTSPTPPLSGDVLGTIVAVGSFVGGGHGAQIDFTSTQDWTTSAFGSKIDFRSAPNGTTTQDLIATMGSISGVSQMQVFKPLIASSTSDLQAAVTMGNTASVAGAFPANGGSRFTGNFTPASGAGLELLYTAGASTVQSYDRTASAYKPINFTGSAFNFLVGNMTFAGTLTAGSAPTTLTDSTGKVLSAALNTVGVAQGGTGATTLTANNVLLGNGTSALQAVAPGSTGNVLTSNGTTWVSSAPAGGGNVSTTGTPTSGQVAEFTSASVVQGVSSSGSGNYLRVTAPTTTAALGSLTLALTPLAVTSGGSGLIAATLGGLRYGSATNTLAELAGNTSATMSVLTQTGTGSVSAAPAWTSTTGTGNVVRATSPTLVTPALGTPTALVLTNATALPPAALTQSSATSGQVLSWNGTIWAPATVSGTGDVTAAANFGSDNRLIRSDGTGKGVQASGVTLDDSDNITGINSLSVNSFTFSSLSGVIPAANGGAGTVNGIMKANGSGTVSAATAGTDYATPTGTETLTNKRITARITSITSSATPSVNTDGTDCVTITAQAAAITSMTTNLTGTPNNFDQLEFRIKDDGTARAITWGASFVAGAQALPTTTTASKTLRTWFEYDSVVAKWVCISSGSDL